MIGPFCPACGHTSHPTRAVGRFNTRRMPRYRAADGIDLHETQLEAAQEQCEIQKNGEHDG